MNNKLTKIIGTALGVSLAVVPLAGNAYYCNAHAEEDHKTKDIQASDILKTLNIQAKSCVLMDKASGRVIVSRGEKDKLPMASMTKMMTVLLLMEEVEKGTIDLNQTTVISEHSASMEGSECFLDANKSYKVLDLLKSIVVASANDSTVAIAEMISGSEEMFVKRMNERAKALNMMNTNYVNSTGLDAEGHTSTAEDMAKLMRELSKYGLVRELSKTWMYDMEHSGGRVTSLTNTNRLVKTNPDCKLAKTGHTDGAGYCITVLGERGGMELIACVMGEADSKTRFDDATKLLNFGFSNFESRKMVDRDVTVGTVKVKGGKDAEIAIYPAEDVAVLTIKGEEPMGAVELDFEDTTTAPVEENEVMGKLTLEFNGETYTTDLVTRDSVEAKTFFDIFKSLAKQ